MWIAKGPLPLRDDRPIFQAHTLDEALALAVKPASALLRKMLHGLA